MYLLNLGDCFSNIFLTTRELAKEHKPYGLKENRKIAKMCGYAAKVARNDIEKNLGKSVISKTNALSYKYLDTNKLDKKELLEEERNDKLERNNDTLKFLTCQYLYLEVTFLKFSSGKIIYFYQKLWYNTYVDKEIDCKGVAVKCLI